MSWATETTAGDGGATLGWGALLVAAAGLATFAPSLLNGFAYDDVVFIVRDARVHALANVPAMFTQSYWANPELGLYRPLTLASFAVDWSLAQGEPALFHLTNTLLHGLVSALVFVLLARWFPFAGALAGGLLFAVHPVHVEAVANVVGRAELIAAAAALGALLLWQRPATGRAGAVRATGVALLLALGLTAKESAIVLLPLLPIVDLAERRLDPRTPAAWLRSNAAALAGIAIVIALWTAIRMAVLGALVPARVDAAFDLATTPAARILTALQAWPVWIGLLFAPVTLLADYGPRVLLPTLRLNAASAFGAAVLLALLAGGLLAAIRGRGRAALCLLWFPITILPVSNLLVPTGVIVAERTLYLPSVAASLAIAAFAGHLMVGSGEKSRPPRWAVLSFALVLGMLAGRSLVRIPAWRDTDAMFAAQLADRPDSFRARWHLARTARDAGRVEEAAHLYDAAIETWPWRQRLNVEAARFAAEHGRLHRARELADHAVRMQPGDLDALRVLAATTLDLGDSTSARALVARGLDISPDDEVLRRMADALGIRSDQE